MRNYGRVVDGNKYCFKCKEWKLLEAFYFDTARNAHSGPCKECRIIVVKSKNDKWRKENREQYNAAAKIRKTFLKYGLSREDLLILWEAQDKACAVCKRPISLNSTEKLSKPHVDHCHVSGVVRGLLCLTCNTGIGMLGDSVDLLEAAKQYLLSRGAPTIKGDPVPASVSADSNLDSLTIH